MLRSIHGPPPVRMHHPAVRPLAQANYATCKMALVGLANVLALEGELMGKG
jgi:hypothetical protein